MSGEYIHELDIREDHFFDILSGNKKHETRISGDVPFQVNDLIEFKEFYFFKKDYTGRKLKTKITYVSSMEITDDVKVSVMSIEVIDGENI